MRLASILVIILFYVFLGLVLWCLCPDMELLLDLTSGLVAWVYQFFYQLVELVKGAPTGTEPMPLGGAQEQVPSAGGVGRSTPSPVNNSGSEGFSGQNNQAQGPTSMMEGQGQGQVGGGRRPLGLDLNGPPPGPESVCPREFWLSANKLKDILMGMQTAPRSDLLPHYEAVEPIGREAYVRSVISEFLKQHSPEDIQQHWGGLLAMRKSSFLYKEFERYLLQKKSRGEE